MVNPNATKPRILSLPNNELPETVQDFMPNLCTISLGINFSFIVSMERSSNIFIGYAFQINEQLMGQFVERLQEQAKKRATKIHYFNSPEIFHYYYEKDYSKTKSKCFT